MKSKEEKINRFPDMLEIANKLRKEKENKGKASKELDEKIDKVEKFKLNKRIDKTEGGNNERL